MAARSDCPVCESPNAGLINSERGQAKPVSLRELERRHGIDKSTLHIHFNEAHPGTPLAVASGAVAAAPGKPEPDSWDGLSTLDRLKRVRDALQQRVDTGRARTDEHRELRMVLKEVALIEGEGGPRRATVQDVDGLPELVAAWAEALEPYPEARAAMAEATRRWESRHGQQVPAAGVAT